METIWLQRPSADIPWGFRLQGGREFAEPLSVQRVTPGSVASNGLCPGDLILKIGNVNATNITHNEAQEVITGASNILQLTIKKSGLTSAPLSPVSSVPQYSSPQQNQFSSSQEQCPAFPDYRVGSGYQDHNNVKNSDGYNTYARGNSATDPYDMRQFEQTPPVSGYSTLPIRSGNRQNSESFRPVQPQNKYPYKSTSGIKLQINPQTQSAPRDDYQRGYNDGPNYSQSQPMSPVQFMNGDSNYQRQTSVGSNRSATNNGYPPQSYFKTPTPFSPTYNDQSGSSTPPSQLQRQASHGSVHSSTISQGFRPGTYLPDSDDAPPPPPPPVNYQPEQYRRPSYDQDVGRSPYQRQPSQPSSYGSSPYEQRQNDYNQYQSHSSPQYEPDVRPFEHDSTPPHYQRQPSNPQYHGERNEPSLQRQTSFGSQQQQPQTPQNYGSPYTPPQSYGVPPPPQQYSRQSSRDQQQQYGRQSSRDQQYEPQPYPTSPPGTTINSFDDILSPFENFQNSNYCDRLFARDNRGDGDSGVDLNSDTPRSMSSNFSSYSPPQPYSGGYNDRGEVQQPQTLLRPAPPAPPPPSVTPPPPPPPPPPSDWAPTPKRQIPAFQDQQGGGEPQMPDKVLNTMLKNKGTQKPFSYVPTGTDLKEFKERARQRRQPRSVMPRGYTGPAIDDTAAEPQQPQMSKPKPGAVPDPDSGVYRHAQYNSPLRMYSSDNATEQFNIQSGGKVDVTGVNSTPERRTSDIKESEVYKMCQAADAKGKENEASDLTGSKADASRGTESRDCSSVPPDDQGQQEAQDRVFSPPPGSSRGQGLSFRVLQWLTDTADDTANDSQESYKPKKARDPLLRHNSEDDEMRFSGLHTKADIPSKMFQRLNKFAGPESRNYAPNEDADRRQDDNDEPERVGNYDEASIRYRGNHIPSPSFRLLQTLAKEDNLTPSARTNTDDEDDGLPDKLNEEDMIDKRYMGGHIPSKSFKALQMYMDDDKSAHSSEGEGGPRIKVISRAKSPKIAPKPDRPVNSPVPQAKEQPSTDF